MKHSMVKKLLALGLSAALCIGAAGALTFQDVDEEAEYMTAVEHLAELGVVKGASSTAFQPDAAVTTAQLCTFLSRVAGDPVDPAAQAEGLKADGWSVGSILWARANGLIGEQGQYAELSVDEINAALEKFCAMLGVETVTVSGTTRGDMAVALDQIVAADHQRLIGVKYTTVTTAEDWGPAIGKVILDLGVEVDAASVSADKFAATAVRVVPGFDFATMQATAPAPQPAGRTVTAAYVCDENGDQAENGTRVAIEMAIGPDLTAGSPFNYDFMSGFNSFVETSYVISLNAPLSTAAGVPLSMAATDAAGASASVTLLADEFVKDTHTWGDITLTYAAWTPHADAAKGSTPMIIWLHGAGEGGTDPTVAIIGNKVVNLITEDIQKHFGDTGAIVLAPQAPTMWLDNGEGAYRTAGDDGRSYYTEALMSLIEAYVAGHPEIDTDRIYIGGCSNGGYMTVNMVMEYPDYFAAAYPVCEAYMVEWISDEKIEAIKDVPMWLTAAKTDGTVVIFEGESDPNNYMVYNVKLDDNGEAIPVDNYSNALYNRLAAAGAENIHYSLFENVVDTTGLYFQADGVTPYEYMGHWSWLYTLNDQCVETIGGQETTLFQWLARQSK